MRIKIVVFFSCRDGTSLCSQLPTNISTCMIYHYTYATKDHKLFLLNSTGDETGQILSGEHKISTTYVQPYKRPTPLLWNIHRPRAAQHDCSKFGYRMRIDCIVQFLSLLQSAVTATRTNGQVHKSFLHIFICISKHKLSCCNSVMRLIAKLIGEK